MYTPRKRVLKIANILHLICGYKLKTILFTYLEVTKGSSMQQSKKYAGRKERSPSIHVLLGKETSKPSMLQY
ncbi:unnamed protein product [Ixodes pacificus]